MTIAEMLKSAIEILGIIAWPAVLIWLVWYLRDEVKRVALRMTEIGLTGAKFAPPPEQVATQPEKGVSSVPTTGKVQTTGSSGTLVQQFIAAIRSYLPDDQLGPQLEALRRDLPGKAGTKPDDQLEALLYYAAQQNIFLAHEKNYNAIFGSQLRLLRQMLQGAVAPIIARQFYDAGRATAPPQIYANYPYEQWIAFLMNGGLITINPNGDYDLTSYGKGFLKYIGDRQLAAEKLL